jgi:hypothetical protein
MLLILHDFIRSRHEIIRKKIAGCRELAKTALVSPGQ